MGDDRLLTSAPRGAAGNYSSNHYSGGQQREEATVALGVAAPMLSSDVVRDVTLGQCVLQDPVKVDPVVNGVLVSPGSADLDNQSTSATMTVATVAVVHQPPPRRVPTPTVDEPAHHQFSSTC